MPFRPFGQDFSSMMNETCPTEEERWAGGFRMIHPMEGAVRQAIGGALVAGGYYSRGSPGWPESLYAAGVMLLLMGTLSQ